MRSIWISALVLCISCSKEAPEAEETLGTDGEETTGGTTGSAGEGDPIEDESIDLTGDGVSRARTLEPFTSCEGVTAGADAPELTGNETVIEGTVRVTRTLRWPHDGEAVRIAPGTTFVVEPTGTVHFGYGCGSDGLSVTAEGTAEAPIRFCPAPTDEPFRSVRFGCVSEDSLARYVHVERGGAGEFVAFGIDKPAVLDHVSIVDAAGVALEAREFGEGSTDVLVQGATGTALRLLTAAAVRDLPPGDYARNDNAVAEVGNRLTGTEVIFRDIGIPYLQTVNRLYFGEPEDTDALIFEPGVEYRLCEGCRFGTGWRGDVTRLEMRGTAERPVRIRSFRGDAGEPGDWGALDVMGGTTDESFIAHTIFEHGGANGATLTVGTAELREVTIRASAGAPVRFVDGGARGTLEVEGEPEGEVPAGLTITPIEE